MSSTRLTEVCSALLRRSSCPFTNAAAKVAFALSKSCLRYRADSRCAPPCSAGDSRKLLNAPVPGEPAPQIAPAPIATTARAARCFSISIGSNSSGLPASRLLQMTLADPLLTTASACDRTRSSGAGIRVTRMSVWAWRAFGLPPGFPAVFHVGLASACAGQVHRARCGVMHLDACNGITRQVTKSYRPNRGGGGETLSRLPRGSPESGPHLRRAVLASAIRGGSYNYCFNSKL